MYRVISCLVVQHDYRLVLLAAAICAATTFTSFSIYSRVAHAQKMMRLGWLFLTGVCTASGIWATHFVAMLAYKAGGQTADDPALTAGSLLVAIVATTLGYFVCSGRSRLALAIAGLTVLVMMAGLAAAVIDRQSSQNSIERIHELVNAASEGIIVAADGIVINVNRRVSELCGQPADDLIGKRVGGELLEE